MLIKAIKKYLDVERKVCINIGDTYETDEKTAKSAIQAGLAVETNKEYTIEEKPVKTAKKPRKTNNEK